MSDDRPRVAVITSIAASDTLEGRKVLSAQADSMVLEGRSFGGRLTTNVLSACAKLRMMRIEWPMTRSTWI